MTSEPWPAPRARAPVDADVVVPGSKSVTNRALVLAALARGRSVVRRPLHSRDTTLMAAGLRVLGVRVRRGADGDFTVSSDGPPFAPVHPDIDVGNAGTVARFLPPVAALASGHLRVDGDPRMRERPLGPLLAALRALGVDVVDEGRAGLPVTVGGRGRVRGGAVTMDASASSQFVSGLLLAGAAYDLGVAVRHAGPPVPSRPHLAMTVAMLRAAGALVDDRTPETWRVAPGPLRAGTVDVEPDLSSAAPFLAAAAVTGGRVSVTGWPAGSTQPGALLPALLDGMGATCSFDGRGLTVRGGRIRGIDADLRDAGELVPVLVAMAALAEGPSRFRGVAHLRGQETDRLAALACEINRLGGAVTRRVDGLAVLPRPLRGGRFRTYDDHRLAMAGAVLGLVVDGVLVENIATTGKTFPGFADRWAELLR